MSDDKGCLESSGNLVGEVLSYRKFQDKIYILLDTWIDKHKDSLPILNDLVVPDGWARDKG